MLLDSLGFIFFSTLEGVAIFSLMLSIYRLKATEFMWQALFVILLMNLQSFVLREELSLAYLVPIINIFLFIFLLITVMRIPVLWSSIITMSGYLAYAVIQSGMFKVLFWDLTLSELQEDLVKGYILQTSSACIALFLAWILYKFGVGFAADFEKLKFKFESSLVFFLIIITLLLMSYLLFINQIWINILFFTIAVSFFLYYSFKKEKWEE